MRQIVYEIPNGSVGRDGVAIDEYGVRTFRMPRLARAAEKTGKYLSIAFLGAASQAKNANIHDKNLGLESASQINDFLPHPRSQRIIGRTALGVISALTFAATAQDAGQLLERGMAQAADGLSHEISKAVLNPA